MAAEGLDFVLRLGSAIVLARLLLPEYFGLISMVMAITAIAEHFKDLGLTTATVQSPDITADQVSTLFWVNTGMGALMMVIVAALAYPIALFYKDQRLTTITLALSTCFFWRGAANQHYALLLRTMRFGRNAGVQIIASALSIVVAIVMAVKGYGYWALVGREVSRNIFYFVGCLACFPWLPGPPRRRTGAGRMLLFGADITGFNLAYFLSTSMDLVLIGRLFGAHQLGIYRQGLQLVFTPMNQIGYPVRVIAESALSRLQQDPERYRNYYRRILATLTLATFPLGLFMAVYAPEIVAVLLGEQWAEAAPIFRILALASFLQPAMATTGAVMVTCGFSRRFLWQGVVSTVALAAFLVAGIPFGMQGVASAQIWSLWLLLIPRVLWSLKDTPVNPATFVAAVSRPAISTAVMVLALVGFKYLELIDRASGRLAAGLGVALVSYLGAWLALPHGKSDLVTMVHDLTASLGLTRLVPRWIRPHDA